MVRTSTNAGNVRDWSFRPTVELLETRTTPATLSLSGSTLSVRGDSASNTIIVGDNGNGDLNVSITGNPGRSGRFENITRINISGSTGNDRIVYEQRGDRTRNLRVQINPGSGNDSVFADILGDINSGRALEIVVGGTTNGNDVIEVQAGSDVDVEVGAIFRVDLRGGFGRDRVEFNYRGELDGALSVVADAGVNDDGLAGFFARARVHIDSGSTGALVGSRVLGGLGEDAVVFLVTLSTGDGVLLDAVLDGGPGQDLGVRTPNVGVTDVETDTIG
jgi:hypothetical protein